jgi:hypothetical protein
VLWRQRLQGNGYVNVRGSHKKKTF